jgi:hypothetical protein
LRYFEEFKMETGKFSRFPILAITGISLIILLSGYGNKLVHPDINSLMISKFLDRNNKGDLSLPEFKKYTFFLVEGLPLNGRAVVKDGLFSDMDQTAAGIGFGATLSSEGPAEKSPQQWIVHGGYSADVPEVPASLRHFYDPVQPPGQHYLTDIANAKIMGSLQKYVFVNPRIDGIQWALGKPGDISEGVQDHKYTWEHGKIWMKLALREANPSKKNEYMASAWRTLGETLHMISDNGCPPHVRNDAHPSPLFNNNTWLGNPDPYEEILDKIRLEEVDVFNTLATGSPDPFLKERFSKMKTVAQIADSLARFTNANFVSNETISGITKSGKQITQITHPEKPYSSPKLENMTYHDKDYSYSTSMGVKQCVDHYYAGNLIPTLCDPFVDKECVKSQAGVLLPVIIEAGAQVIKLYIPKLTVEIKSADHGLVKGEIRHKTDEEYPSEIKYTGEVILSVKDAKYKEINRIKIPAKNGIFEQAGVNVPEGGNLTATIEFGGVSVQSMDFSAPPMAPVATTPGWVTQKKYWGYHFNLGVMSHNTWNSKGGPKSKSDALFTYEIGGHTGMDPTGRNMPQYEGIVFKQEGNVLTESWKFTNNRNGAFYTYDGSATITLQPDKTVSFVIHEILYFRYSSESPQQTCTFDCSAKGLKFNRQVDSGIELYSAANPCLFLKSLHYSNTGGFDESTSDGFFCNNLNHDITLELALYSGN